MDLINNLHEKIDGMPNMSIDRLLHLVGKLRERGKPVPRDLRHWYGTAPGASRPAAEQVEDHRLKASNQRLQADNQELVERVNELEQLLEFKRGLAAITGRPLRIPTPKRTGKLSPMMAWTAASDWHVGEVVDPATVNNLNEYSPTIARQRAQRYFERVANQIGLLKNGYDIERLGLWLGGDLITGAIHPDVAESNEIGPFGEAELILDVMEGGIRFWLDHIDKILVATNDGNHGRVTDKQRVSTRWKYSLELFMYKRLKDRLRDVAERVEWQINTGLLTYVDVYDYTFRFVHGDPIRYQGGVGGLMIPLNKAIAQWNEEIHADWTTLGHFHSLEYPKRAMVNGSLIGYTAYSQKIRAGFEEAQQLFWAVHPKVGRCHMTPIVVD